MTAHHVAKEGISWHLLPSLKKSTLKKIQHCLFQLHGTKLRSGQGMGRELESCVSFRDFVTLSKPPTRSPTPRNMFSSQYTQHLISLKVPRKDPDVPSKCPQAHSALFLDPQEPSPWLSDSLPFYYQQDEKAAFALPLLPRTCRKRRMEVRRKPERGKIERGNLETEAYSPTFGWGCCYPNLKQAIHTECC